MVAKRPPIDKTQARSARLRGIIERMTHLHHHDHDVAPARDAALGTDEGIRTVWLALAVLGATTLGQIVIVWLSGSVALLADTVHNLGDTLNSIPLLLALYLARRAPTRCYTYGFGRAEDLAGVLIVGSIAVSAGVIFWESFARLLDPQPISHIWWVVVAALVGYVGNEVVARVQIRTGRRIGSEALIADGMHARVDGLTSLAVLIPAIGSVFGLRWLDPIVGLLIGVTIVFITRDAFVRVWQRLMDAVDPAFVDQVEQLAGEVAGVEQVVAVRARWIGHVLDITVDVAIAEGLLQVESQAIVGRLRQHVAGGVPAATAVRVGITARADDAYDPFGAAAAILPPRYRDNRPVSAAPMGAAALTYNADGSVAWDQTWTGFCELALAGGAPHRGTLLEPIDPGAVGAQPDAYARVLRELERGLRLVTGRPVVRSDAPGWIGVVCESEAMALWLLRAIVVENVSVRREGNTLFFPAGPHFRLEREIKNVITVVAKTTHYWTEHAQSLTTRPTLDGGREQ